MKPDWNYKLVNFFINRTHLTVLLLALVVMTGLLGFSRLRTEGFPELPIPMAIVTTIVPGAGPEAIMDSVTVPIESAIKDIKDIVDISSYSARNASTLVITIAEGVDIEKKIQEIKNKIGTVNLPEGTRDPNVMVPEAGAPTYIIAVTGNYSIQQLLEFEEFKDDLMGVDEVSEIKLLNNLDESIYIEIEPQFNTPDVINQIKSANISFPLGEISVDGDKVSISGQSSTETLEDFSDLPIFVGNEIFKLKDISNIYQQLSYNGQIHRVGYHLDNDDFAMRGALFYQIELDPGTDVLKIDPEIQDALEDLNNRGDDLDYVMVFSMADQTRMQVDEIVSGAFGGKFNSGGFFANFGYLFGGIWLLLLVLLIFLDLRSAVITIITIPLSFLIVFAFLSFMGIQLNTMVLFSLVLVLGLIVDPAIVILESMKRYLELGSTPKEAALKAVKTVGNGIFIAVLTSFIVFIPFAVVTGLFGEIIRYIPLTVIPALVASYFVPMIFLTWIGSKVLKSNGKKDIVDEDDPKALWKPAQWFIKINRKILDKRWLQVTVIIAGLVIPILIAGALFATGKIKQVQFSQPDDGLYVMVSIPVDPGMTNAERLEAAKEGEMALSKFNEDFYGFFYTAPAGLGMGGSEELVIYIELADFSEREKTATEIAEDIQKNLEKRFGEGARAEVAKEGPPEGDYPVVVSIFDEDSDKLFKASEKIAKELLGYEEVLDVRYDSDEERSMELSFVIDKEKAAEQGLTAPIVFGQISSMLGENRILTINDTDIIVRIPEDKKPSTIDSLRNAFIFSPKGQLVKLDDIGDVIEQEVPETIQRYDGKRYQQVSARIADSKDIIEVQRRIDEWVKESASSMELSENDFKGGVISGINFEDAFTQLFTAIYFSIIITYIIFVVFFRSFVQPFIILLSLPLMFVGVFPALVLFTNGQFGFLETLGIIMLIGIVENVGIFMIDYANQKIDQGMNKKDAIALSSGVRFRPILLTQLTSLMGLLPLAIVSPFWRGLAVTVIVGIASSGLLALFVTPVAFYWLTRRKAQ